MPLVLKIEDQTWQCGGAAIHDKSRTNQINLSRGIGAQVNMAADNLNQSGYIQHHGGLVNVYVKVIKLNNALHIMQRRGSRTEEG
jgi:hypothetical protein